VIAFLSSAWSVISGRALAIGAAVLAALAAVGLVFRAGKRSAQVDGLERQLDNARIRDDVENEVRRAGPDAVHDELMRDWTRD
jgi:hypothetical protein